MNETLNVVDYFNNTLVDKNKDIVKDSLDSLIKKANVDAGENKILVTEINRLQETYRVAKNALSRRKIFLVLTFVLFPLFFIWLPLYFQAKNKHSKILDEEKAKDVEEINTRKENKIIETYKQISPLLNLIQSKTITDIIERTYEQIKFDDYLSNNKQELLKKDGSFTKNESVINCVSLSLFKNPTAIFKKVSMSIYMHVWWDTVSYRDSSGREHTRMISVSLPAPRYDYSCSVAFESDVADKLNFNNYDKMKQSLPMEVAAFNKKFRCWRNDEAQFRMLFTVLAQEELLKLLEINGDFVMEKEGKITTVTDSTSIFQNEKSKVVLKQFLKKNRNDFTSWNNNDTAPKISLAVRQIYHYDMEEVKENFILINKNAFRDIYFIIAPILAIPAYQHFGKENKKVTLGLPSDSFIESIVNSEMDTNILKGNVINTQEIIKVTFDKKIGKYFRYNLNCNGFAAYPDTVHTQGGSISVIRFPSASNSFSLFLFEPSKEVKDLLVTHEVNSEIYEKIKSNCESFVQLRISNNKIYIVCEKNITDTTLDKITKLL